MSLAWCSGEGHLVRFNIWHKYYQFIMKRNLNPRGKRGIVVSKRKRSLSNLAGRTEYIQIQIWKQRRSPFMTKLLLGCLSTFLKEKCINRCAMCPSCLPSSLITQDTCQGGAEGGERGSLSGSFCSSSLFGPWKHRPLSRSPQLPLMVLGHRWGTTAAGPTSR